MAKGEGLDVVDAPVGIGAIRLPRPALQHGLHSRRLLGAFFFGCESLHGDSLTLVDAAAGGIDGPTHITLAPALGG
jgi:hypothetical protein